MNSAVFCFCATLSALERKTGLIRRRHCLRCIYRMRVQMDIHLHLQLFLRGLWGISASVNPYVLSAPLVSYD